MTPVRTILGDPTTFPVTVDELKTQLEFYETDRDDYLTALIAVATASVEDYTGLSISQRPVTFYFADFGNVLQLDRGGLTSLALSYRAETTATWTTLTTTTWTLEDFGDQANFCPPASGFSPPAVYSAPGITAPVRLTATVSSPATAAPLKHAIKLLAANLFELRTPVQIGSAAIKIPLTLEHLFNPYKIRHV